MLVHLHEALRNCDFELYADYIYTSHHTFTPMRRCAMMFAICSRCGIMMFAICSRCGIRRKFDTDSRSMDDLPSFNCRRGEDEEGNDDDWVVVKKQKFTILIPPPSPSAHQQTNIEMRAKPSDSEQPKAAYSTPIAKKGRANGNKNRPSSSSQAYARGRVGSMGAVTVVNLRMRAMNLERKLGGLPPLLGPADRRFTAVLESKKLSQYQLANLTTSKLKDMGMNTVGRRRKLIHAIDRLCRPYYYTAPHRREEV